MDQSICSSGLTNGITNEHLKVSLVNNPSKIMVELQSKVEKSLMILFNPKTVQESMIEKGKMVSSKIGRTIMEKDQEVFYNTLIPKAPHTNRSQLCT